MPVRQAKYSVMQASLVVINLNAFRSVLLLIGTTAVCYNPMLHRAAYDMLGPLVQEYHTTAIHASEPCLVLKDCHIVISAAVIAAVQLK